jgi:hypothetical protein
MNLQINLQDGFNGDEVNISINGKQVYHKKDVRTRTQIGLADMIETRISSGQVSLEIQLVNRQISKVIDTQVTDTLHIGISVSPQNQIVYHIQDTPFYYL